ncbi:hypothetical protein PGRAN_11561 [Listeria grandensis FSL F6-0971]|uniref:Uncharacterized protein n=2 Tax=Listeria grandensis TaxID=1494963 RepID=W7B681_9LIST|nr:hypothetical protein PGRAN_11561 [Listeria grandensis FSL F6-0971]
MKKQMISLAIATSLIAATALPTFASAEEDQPVEEINNLNGEQIFNSLEDSNFASVYGDVPEMMLRANVPVDNSGVTAPAAIAGHYFHSSSYVNKSVKYQNREQGVRDIATFVLGLGAGAVGTGKSVATIITWMGGASALGLAISGKAGAQFPIRITTYKYFAKASHRTPTYSGYTIVTVKNTSTGKVVQSKRNLIAKTGI